MLGMPGRIKRKERGKYPGGRRDLSSRCPRLACALYVHDNEISTLVHPLPHLTSNPDRVPQLQPDRLFTAGSAAQWKSYNTTMLHDSMSEHLGANVDDASHALMACAYLECVSAERRKCVHAWNLMSNPLDRIKENLLAWTGRCGLPQVVVLLQSTCLPFFTDQDMMERAAAGRDGPEAAADTELSARAWANSSHALAALLFANAILDEIGSLSVSDEAAIQTPRAIFQAGLALSTYVSFREESAAICQLTPLDTQLRDAFVPHTIIHSLPGLAQREHARAKHCFAINSLRRVGNWGISERLASVIDHLA